MVFTNPGTYTVTLQVLDNEGQADTDSVTITVNEPVVAEGIFADSVVVSVSGNSKKGYTASAKVIVKDSKGKTVRGAVVYGEFSGAVSGSKSGTTRKRGDVTLRSSKFKSSGSVTFQVTNIVKDGYAYQQ
jgi:PKD repeat protein